MPWPSPKPASFALDLPRLSAIHRVTAATKLYVQVLSIHYLFRAFLFILDDVLPFPGTGRIGKLIKKIVPMVENFNISSSNIA